MRARWGIAARVLPAIVAALAGALTLPAVSSGAAGRCGHHPWCKTSLSPAARAKLLLAAMSQGDKVGILTGQAGKDVDLPPISWTDGALGAGGLGSGANSATAMPAGTALAANFDSKMASTYGGVVGQEVRHRGFDGDFGPTVNLMRTPLGGRTFEAYGEDPFLAARTAVGWIRGFQRQGVMADVKHYAANNQEGQAGPSPLFGTLGGRAFTNVHVDDRTLHETELMAFEAAIKEGHSATVMCSYNLLRGTYACANPFLLLKTLRGLWGFNGFVVSDAAACHETPQNLEAGLNFDIADSCYTAPQVYGALASGMVTQATLDRRVFETLRTLFAFGFFDHPERPKDRTQDHIAADRAVARHAEERGAVLLRNNGVLPITPNRVHSIAVIGPAAQQYIFGGGSSQVKPYSPTTVRDGIAARAAKAHINVAYDDGSNPQSATALAKRSDVAIVVAADTESEGVDKPCMSLVPQCSGGQSTPPQPYQTQASFGDQDALIRNVAAANKRTVVVLETGGPVLTPWRGSIAALLEGWYPGDAGGNAIARVLFGDVDASGRLPVTFPRSAGDIQTARGGTARYPGTVNPGTKCNLGPQASPCPYWQETYGEGVMVGYRWYDSQHITPAFPFGFGLSYTRFRFSGLKVTRRPGHAALVRVTVRNVGRRPGVAVPEVYVALPSLRGVPEPPWQLKGFAKVTLAPGHQRRVSIPLNARSFSYWSNSAGRWRIGRGCDRIAVGSSVHDLPLRAVVSQGGAACGRRPKPRTRRRHCGHECRQGEEARRSAP